MSNDEKSPCKVDPATVARLEAELRAGSDQATGVDEALKHAFDEPALAPGDIEALFERTQSKCQEAEKHPCYGLRCLPTRWRVAITSLVLLGIGAVAYQLLGARPLMDGMSWRDGLFVGAMAVAIVGFVAVAMRPLHRPPLGQGATAALWVLGIGGALGLAFVPPDAPAMVHDDSLVGSLQCMLFGALLGVPVYFLVRLFERRTQNLALGAAAIGALVGAFVLDVHCPAAAFSHRLIGHFIAAVLFVGAALGLQKAFRRMRSGPAQ